MALAAIVLIAMLFVPAYADRDRVTAEPMVVTTPTSSRIALIAVDGLTHEILQSRPDFSPPAFAEHLKAFSAEVSKLQ